MIRAVLAAAILVAGIITFFLLPEKKSAAAEPFPGATDLFAEIRMALIHGNEEALFQDPPELERFDPAISHLYVTLFQPGAKPLRWGTRRDSLTESLQRVISKIRHHPRFTDFDVADPARTRIKLEYLVNRMPMDDISLLGTQRKDQYRFEPGITGLHFSYSGQDYYYLPTEAYSKSHMSLNQTFDYLSRRLGFEDRSRRKRIARVKDSISDVELIESRAYISYQDKVLALYRGYPDPYSQDKEDIRRAFLSGVDWMLDNMKPNGQFLYFYDGYSDSYDDYQHPRNPDYYNILRHSGGTITLLWAYKRTGERKYLDAARRSIGFFLQQTRTRDIDGETGRYVFFNKKSKLGGEGIGLAALMRYYELSGDGRFLEEAHQMARHLLSRIEPSGEFMTYFIHLRFNNGAPLLTIPDEDRKELFSFYYPGEALMGLALYEKHAPLSDQWRAEIRQMSRKALDFLIYERPKKYPDQFLPLPADGWLMQAIEEWWARPDMQNQDYADHVYADARKMIDHMYLENNAPYKDYIGHFFYRHGDHAYPDGARAEGMLSAYFLAKLQGRREDANYFLHYNHKAARALMQTYNSPESSYFAPNPDQLVGSFRFKLTRQWVRVDSVQHTACFFARLYPELK
ncbi:protein containing Six-hairpin glycosidase-like domain protein [Emcibacter nanhaiensis]|uniref:Protein containing Six-hairpin glycosidase-like domain protein n=1 Tax=Emcibacter nanhaiensis TaxID=1505037 RepID=A0A501PH12_9PROT|nr:protein containing Six-hairpin glycosidase-like domain protein [Emcibacter nanhaiensis]TPD59368.1 protein containing Six-hairpin glycosidase-like domain protein [Emcibacter nanhaiensis]